MIRELAIAFLTLQTAPVAPVFVPAGMHAYSMPSQSMRPTIDDGDVFLADRRRDDCGSTQPAPGDVVIIDRDGTPFVKRVVAGPGQRVEMKDGLLILDGAPVRRVEVGAEILGTGLTATTIRETLPTGATYLTLDYGSGQPMDDFGPIIVPEGHWFTLGDNRDNSIDGRSFGPSPQSRLCGVAFRIVRSANPARIGMRP
ncbi:MAG: signal peptidase I [bacterium]|nr:MAG: signal peptidase I [bacterium]